MCVITEVKMEKKRTDAEIENFVFNIVRLRNHHKLSKREMAKILRIGIKSLDKLEKGVIPPRIGVEVVFNIYKNFGVAPKDLFGQRLK